eukprot:gene3043-594_t
MRVGIVGPGRIGKSLAAKLRQAGHQVRLFARGEAGDADGGRGDVLVLAVPDREIAAVASGLAPASRPILHCSGYCDLSVLQPHSPAGSLQAVPDLEGVPAAVAGDPEALQVAKRLAVDLGMRPFEISAALASPGDRRLYHAAAVIAGNFATVLLEAGTQALCRAGVPQDQAACVLLPLALQSLRNAPPYPSQACPMPHPHCPTLIVCQALTGPVVRGDDAVISGHREALAQAGLQDVLQLYDSMTVHTRKADQVLTRPLCLGYLTVTRTLSSSNLTSALMYSSG